MPAATAGGALVPRGPECRKRMARAARGPRHPGESCRGQMSGGPRSRPRPPAPPTDAAKLDAAAAGLHNPLRQGFAVGVVEEVSRLLQSLLRQLREDWGGGGRGGAAELLPPPASPACPASLAVQARVISTTHAPRRGNTHVDVWWCDAEHQLIGLAGKLFQPVHGAVQVGALAPSQRPAARSAQKKWVHDLLKIFGVVSNNALVRETRRRVLCVNTCRQHAHRAPRAAAPRRVRTDTPDRGSRGRDPVIPCHSRPAAPPRAPFPPLALHSHLWRVFIFAGRQRLDLPGTESQRAPPLALPPPSGGRSRTSTCTYAGGAGVQSVVVAEQARRIQGSEVGAQGAGTRPRAPRPSCTPDVPGPGCPQPRQRSCDCSSTAAAPAAMQRS